MHSFPSGAPHWEEEGVIAELSPTISPCEAKKVITKIPRPFAFMGNLLSFLDVDQRDLLSL
jgi:hypothetical protein